MKDAYGYEMDNFPLTIECDECGEEITVTVKGKDFWEGKTGLVMCGHCGCVTKPCVVCHGSRIETCDKCPFEDAEIVNFIGC